MPVQLNLVVAILVNAATFWTFTYLAAIATGPPGLTDRAVPVLLAVFGIGASPAALWILALTQGALFLALGSTLIARILAAAHSVPTMGGSFAAVALNIGAVIGPVTGGIAIEAIGVRGPVMVSAVLVLLAVLLWSASR